MSEIVCPLCDARSPELALYCQHCGQPLKCQGCGANLLPTARACIQCGKLIPERSNNDQFQVGTSVVPPGYNRLKFHETYAADVRDLDLTVSDHAIEQIGSYIGDLIPSLVGTRSKGHSSSSGNHQPQKQSEVVEVALDMPPTKPQLPAATSPSPLPKSSHEVSIWDIFRKEDGGGLRLDITNLKASGKWDHILRIVYLYLYAKLQSNEDKVPRIDVYGVLDNLGLKDTNNISRYINQAQGIISNDDGTLRLTFEGRKQAEKYIEDVFNDELPGSWPTKPDSRPSVNRPKKTNKKSTEQQTGVDTAVAGWISHPVTNTISEAIDHAARVNLSLVDKALLALYGIYRAGFDQEVSPTSIMQYLYGAFDVPINLRALNKALHRLRTEKSAKSSFINYRPNQGYKSSPSGRKYVEETLLKQPQLVSNE